jgi:hypothetical protein
MKLNKLERRHKMKVFDGDNWDYYCTTNNPQISINEAIKSITEHRAQQ